VTAIQIAITGTTTFTCTAADNATATSANNLYWSGSNASLGNYSIKASFNGSGAGTQLVAGALSIPFLSSTNSGWPTTIAAAPTTANTTDIVVPDVAMSDVFQSTTGFEGTVATIINGVKVNHSYATISGSNDNTVAIVTFKPMASATFPQGTGTTLVDDTGPTFNVSSYSLTPQNFTATWSFGSTVLSQFTGNHVDENSLVYSTGRNQDSGTRMTYLAETGYGVNVPVVQQYPTVTSGTVTAVNEYPITTINGISTGAVGNGGESSGSAVRGYLAYPFSKSLSFSGANSAYFVTVLGTADSASVYNAAIELPYVGTYYSATATEEGTYTLWSYEHMLYNPAGSGLTGATLSFANAVKSNIEAANESGLAQAGLPLSVMQVTRPTDGGSVTSAVY
jgi:hypothetical protein